jgi:hypothetical protein
MYALSVIIPFLTIIVIFNLNIWALIKL